MGWTTAGVTSAPAATASRSPIGVFVHVTPVSASTVVVVVSFTVAASSEATSTASATFASLTSVATADGAFDFGVDCVVVDDDVLK